MFVAPMMLATLLAGCFGGVVFDDGTTGGVDVDDTAPTCGPVEGVATDAGVYMLDLSADPDPPVTGTNVLHVGVGRGDDASPLDGATLTIVPFMPEMAHGISGEPEITELGDGCYDAEWAYPMAGEWEVALSITAGGLAEDVYTAIYEVG